MKRKILGVNYLHSHPRLEKALLLDSEHVIVDREDWEEVVDYFHRNPETVGRIGKIPKLFEHNSNAKPIKIQIRRTIDTETEI